jgi:hypothetical protein
MEQETRTTLTKTEKQLCITTGSMVHVGTSQASAPFESSTATRQQQMASSSDPPLVAMRLSFTNPLSGESLFDMDYHKGDDIMEQVSLKLAMSTSLFSLACGDVPLTGEGSDIMDGSMISIIFQKPTCDDDDDDDEPKVYIGESTWHIYKFTYHEKVIWTGTFCGAEWGEEIMWDMPGGQAGMWPWAEDIFKAGNEDILQVCLDGVGISPDDLTDKLAEMTESATIDFMIDDAFELDWGEAEPGFPLQHSPSEPDN